MNAEVTAHPLVDAVRDALACVVDPELDESLVDLNFVDDLTIADQDVTVVLRLPTYWCSPNFAYLMLADARQAVSAVRGVHRVRVVLKDHCADDELTQGLAEGRSFKEIFPEESDCDDLDELRRTFRTKAFTMRQEQLVQLLLDSGLTTDRVSALTLEELRYSSDGQHLFVPRDGGDRLIRGGGPIARTYLARRAERFPSMTSSRLIVDPDGQPVDGGQLLEYLRTGRRHRVSMAMNSLFCRGMLDVRYDLESPASPVLQIVGG